MTKDVILYGLRIRSEIPLPARPAIEAGACPDLEIVYGPTTGRLTEPPPGRVLAYYKHSPNEWYSFNQSPEGTFVLRFADICDFVVDASLRRAEVRQGIEAKRALVPVFAAGALPAFVLVMSGQPVLHASAVDIGGQVLAVVGRSGMGKSTMATLLCQAGAGLVTDDVLRLTPAPAPRCYVGPDELRLRSGASTLAREFESPPDSRETEDGRSALRAPLSPSELLPLAAIVIPFPDRNATMPEVRRLDPTQSCLALLACPRLLGWQSPEEHAGQFRLMAEVSKAVPIYEARVPWGPPFLPNVAAELIETLGLQAPRVRRTTERVA
jgi:hypothetical protein